jgi:LPS sulfotransferase NodH
MSRPSFLLVTGSMRSGTTLLGELLYSRYEKCCRHPQLSFANDNINTLRELATKYTRLLAEGATADEEQRVNNCVTQLLVKKGWQDRKSGGLTGLLQNEINAVAPTPEALPLVHGLKTTGLFDEFQWMKRFLGQARQIMVFRDPRDVLVSNLKRTALKKRQKETSTWNRFRDMLLGRRGGSSRTEAESIDYDGYLVLSMMENGYSYWLRHAGDADLIMIRYENLVSDPESSMRKVMLFLQLPAEHYDWKSLQSSSIVSNSSFLIQEPNGAVPAGIQTSAVGRYKSTMSAFDLWLTQWLLGPMMQELNYPLEDCGSYQPDKEALRAWMMGFLRKTEDGGYHTDRFEALLSAL